MQTFNYNDTTQINKIFKGRKIVKTSTHKNKEGDLIGIFELDNFTKISIIGNIGCPYCSDGWYAIQEIHKTDNYITEIIIEREEIPDKGTKYILHTYSNGKPNGDAITLVGTDGKEKHGTGFTLEIENII